MSDKATVRLWVFQEPTGKYHHCDADADMLDARGKGYDTKAEATRAAIENAHQWGKEVESIGGSGVSRSVCREFGIPVTKS